MFGPQVGSRRAASQKCSGRPTNPGSGRAAYRKLRGLSQEELAERADLVQHHVSRIATGAKEAGVVVVLRLCRALNVPRSDLLARLTIARLRRFRLR
ncbi:MAG TPA: helix-turn-helix transcriptional regulator [Thermoanaerobaculia bacterium]